MYFKVDSWRHEESHLLEEGEKDKRAKAGTCSCANCTSSEMSSCRVSRRGGEMINGQGSLIHCRSGGEHVNLLGRR